MIPKVLHHIWVGGNSLPLGLARLHDGWLHHHPDWQFERWDEHRIEFPLVSGDLVRQASCHAQVADILRLEILYRVGGVYVDYDVECRRPIDPLLDSAMFLASEDGLHFGTAVIGAEPGHPLLYLLLRSLPNRLGAKPPNEETGPVFVTKTVMKAGFGSELTVCPTRFFYPYLYNQPELREGKFEDAYAVHHWAHSWADVPAKEAKRRTLAGNARRIVRRLLAAPRKVADE